MSKYAAPLADMRFALFDVLGAEALFARLPGGDIATRDVCDAVLEEAARFAGQVLAPLNQSGDQQGCTFADGTVTTPKGFKEAYAQFCDGGWAALNAPEPYGGQHMPDSRVLLSMTEAETADFQRHTTSFARLEDELTALGPLPTGNPRQAVFKDLARALYCFKEFIYVP